MRKPFQYIFDRILLTTKKKKKKLNSNISIAVDWPTGLYINNTAVSLIQITVIS